MSEKISEKKRELVTAEEERTISRLIMAWINACPDIPSDIPRINYEQFQTNAAGQPMVPSMALSVIQGTYIIRRYVVGGHRGEYQFSIFYRIKPGNSNDARLTADEVLDNIGEWARNNYPDLGADIKVLKVEPTNRAALLGVTESGDEDHLINLHLIYEII